MNKTITILIFFFSVAMLPAQENSGISVNTGCDIVSSYNWRSIDFGNSPALQPYIGVGGYGLEFTVWGSYAFIANETINEKKVPFTEVDLILKYSYELPSGSIYAELVDFYYPFLGQKFSDFSGVENNMSVGAHWVNLAVGYKGGESFPVSLKFDYGLHNDADYNIYFEIGYAASVGSTSMDFFMGFAKGENKSDLYGIEDGNLAMVNLGVTAGKVIKITDSFSIPLSTQFVFNPYASKAFLVFKLSL